MGRRPQGYKLHKRRNVWCVRFTIDGKRHEYSTGEATRTEAERVAKPLYAEALRGRLEPKQQRGPGGVGRDVGELIDEWLAEYPLRPTTRELYKKYGKRWRERFQKTHQLTDKNIAAHCRERLREVRGKTAGSEMAALRTFLTWAFETEAINHMPSVPRVKKSIAGTPYKERRRVKAPELSAEEIEEILKLLPDKSGRTGFVIRDRFIVAWETTLRPDTLSRLRCPENWSPGSGEINVTAEDDKELYSRPIPLTKRAERAMGHALEIQGIKSGLIFGLHRHGPYLKEAAKKVLPESKAAVFIGQHFRSAAITRYMERTGNVPGIMAMAGHKHASTTSLYARPSTRAARQMLADAAERDSNSGEDTGEER